MFKVTAIMLLALIGGLYAAHCESCGSECSRACGTRRFRACCFNYLRKKRGEDSLLWLPTLKEMTKEPVIPAILVSKLPESWPAENYQPSSYEDTVEHRLQNFNE